MTGYPSVRAVSQDARIDQIVVDGLPVTNFRATEADDTPMRIPGYTNTEPFAYGSSRPLVIPRTNSNFPGDVPGEGDLWWLRKGARVRYERVDSDGNLIATDYRGFIIAIRSSGREWIAEVAGELSGRANLIDQPPALIRRTYDVGSLVTFTMEGLGYRVSPRFPSTGVQVVSVGGTTAFGTLSALCAQARTHDDDPWTIMPTTWGGNTWSFAQKDVTTKHFTVLADGQRIVLDLVDDLSEQPNTIFGSGVTSDGLRYRGAKYPGFFQGEPAPYPFADTSHAFGTGTTNGDTDTGDGITVMVRKLARVGYLNDRLSNLTTYTSDVARAVNRLKDAAGLVENGIMTAEAWAALWNTDVVGFSPEGATIFPIAQDPTARYYNYSSTGDVIGRNPDYVPGTIRVDRSIDFGVCDEDVARRYARGLIQQLGGNQWAGTITLNNVSVFSGEHDADDVDTLTADDLMPARDIRPGMNAWLPYFAGGTLLHVAGVDVNDTTVTLTVSSAALDIFDLTQALQRNADSKRNIYREWRQTLHSAKAPNNYVQRDKEFGILDHDIALTGGQWNMVRIIMGQGGTVSLSTLHLSVPTEFYYAVFGKEMSEDGLNGYVGNPTNLDDDGLTVWEHTTMDSFFERQDLLLVEGHPLQPCGYSWKKGYESSPDGTTLGDRTANPLTGTFVSRATWTYATEVEKLPVVYLAIWPEADCNLEGGRLFWALEDDVT